MSQSHVLVGIPEDFFDEIQFEMTDCPVDAIRLHLQRAVVEFCEVTHYWQEDIGPIVVADSIVEYDIPTSRNVAIVSIMEMSFIDDGDSEKTSLENCKTTDVKYRFWQETPFTVSLYPNDSLKGKEISLVAALKPVLSGEQFKYSQFININHRDAVIANAKERLFKIPKKSWTDLNQAQINKSIFSEKSADVLRQQGRGFSVIPDKSIRKPRSFF